MRKLLFLSITLGAVFLLRPQTTSAPNKAPDATLGAQTIGRMLFYTDGTTELYGYYTFLEGLDAPMFNGGASTRNAHFTFRTERAGIEFVANGPLMHLIARPLSTLGSLTSVYFDSTPDQDINKPETFSDGELIATFRARGTRGTISFGAGATGTLLLVRESARDVTVGGKTINVRDLVDQLSVTLTSTSPASFEELQSLRSAGALSVPFGGVGYIGNNQ